MTYPVTKNARHRAVNPIGVTIRPASDSDACYFPSIERSAGTLFEMSRDLAWIAQAPDRSVKQYRALIAQGLSWTAVSLNDMQIGFVACGLESRGLHVWELAVHRSHQNRGIGKALLDRAIVEAKARGLAAITLTTFTDVPWNAPFYMRHGFVILPNQTLSPQLRRLLETERAQGLPIDRRCAMCLSLT